MALITTDQLREHVETDLSDDALQRIIDAQEKEIVKKYGAHASQVDWAEPKHNQSHVFLSRPVSEITEVVEYYLNEDGSVSDQKTLAADDYELVPQWKRVNRLSSGTNPMAYWGGRVKVTYTPEDENDERTLVLIQLCELQLNYQYGTNTSIGDYSTAGSMQDLKKQKRAILSQLSGRLLA